MPREDAAQAQIQRLKKDLEHHESDFAELRADMARQCGHYNEL